MYLKRLQLVGFKTFADKTVVDFSPGVTAIVGPNGSGKSNIADAILWVLGEQRPSAIRGNKLQDVIFSGSALRKPTGLAEVSLTVDNSDGSLPLPYDEITITRRAYRNGEGEFAINKTPCRLKDIHELFLDTGVGRESYALVNQSEVDAVLSADPQARRPLFEEAAGIHKFRVKKREALRKLEATETNLVRVRDIVREIERQLGPLERQAEVATRFNETKSRLESLEKNFLIAEARQIDQEIQAVHAEREKASMLADSKAVALHVAEDRAASLAKSLADIDAVLDSIRTRHQNAHSQVERTRSDRELAQQRGQGIAAQVDLIKAELDDVKMRLENAQDTLKSVQSGSGDARDRIAGITGQIQILDGQRRELLPKIAELRHAEESRVLRAAERERARAQREAELVSLESRERQTELQVSELGQRAAEAEARLLKSKVEIETLRATHGAFVASLKDSEAKVGAATNAVQSAREELAKAQSTQAKLRADLASISSRLQTLRELEAAQEGYFSGVRAVMQAAKRGKLNGEYTLVADAFRAPEGYDIAFDVALAGSVQDIIVEDEDEAKAAIDLLKRDRAGRATFLPLSRIRPNTQTPNIPNGMRGFLGVASELATYERRFSAVIEMLLGRVLVCETVDDALAVSDRARGWGKIVTLAGEVLLPSGAISGGSAAKSSGSLLHRKTEIATLTDRTKAERHDLERADERIAAANDALKSALAVQTEASGLRQQVQQQVNSAERSLDQVTRDADRFQRERADLESRLSQVMGERQSAIAALADKRAAFDEAEVAQKHGQDAVRSTESSGLLPMLLESDQRLQEELLTLRIQLASIQEKARQDEQTLSSAQSEIDRLNSQIARRSERLSQLEIESNDLASLSANTEELRIAAWATLVTVQTELDTQQYARTKIAADAWEAQLTARALAEERSVAQQAAQSAELREAKLQMQQSQSVARLLEEYDITHQDALSLPESPFVAPDTPREVARLRRELRSFGEVNTGAAAEYVELRERYDHTTVQQRDAEEAKDKVLVAIREIDDSTRDLFMGTFRQVGVAFEGIFQRLMGGGHTELSLTDPGNLLETGIDINVQAPGKKRQNLLLLSGGERALTAVALLFAFLQVRPAPFCVMDEVDAPLDGVNVERFANLLRDFGRDGQFLIITHNPSTMEAARTWYGVTMQEPGVSRVLSMEAPASAEADSAATRERMVAAA